MIQRLGFFALAVALLLAAFWAPRSKMARLANLEVPNSSFASVYVQMKADGRGGKCLVSGRAGTTEKRSDEGLAKASWRCRLVVQERQPLVLLAESKNEPSFVFVPVSEVEDPYYPWLYESLRSEAEGSLPPMRWVHLFYNRQFQGLYLQASLPGRHFAAQRLERRRAGAEGSAGEAAPAEAERLELLTVRGDRLTCVDRKLRPLCPIYTLAVADGVFPRPMSDPTTELLSWLLDTGSAGRSVSFILSDRHYDTLERFPLPFAAERWLGDEPFRDGRYHQWQSAPDPAPEVQASLYSRLEGVETELETLGKDLDASIRASCVVMGCDAAELSARLASSPSRRWIEEPGSRE